MPARHDKYERLIAAAQKLRPTTTAIAHPCDEVSLEAAVEAARLGLIAPILVGPAARIRDVAARAGLDISARCRSSTPRTATIRRRRRWRWCARPRPRR